MTDLDISPVDDAARGEDGQPIPDLYAKDGLHLSSAGYARWTAAVAEALAR